jgi:GTP-binding protein
MTKPIVAIVGRPNVGKSTLFNRLLGEPRAIVEDVPGTTRDRVYADISRAGYDFALIDTGGLEPEPTSDLRQKVKAQVEAAIAEADVILFLVDVKDGVTIPDLEVAEALRRSQKTVILAVNKCDNEQRCYQAPQFHELALGEPVPISAYHGTGIDELMSEVSAKLPPSPPPIAELGMMKLAIVGRPNVGKSMLLNAILGRERVIVDEAPGTTHDAIDTVFSYDGEPMLLIDTAGIRRRGRIKAGIEHHGMLRALKAVWRADVALLVIDATEKLTAQDAHIAGYVEQAVTGMVLVVNKWDLIEDRDEAQYATEVRLKFMPYVPILFTSAKLSWGIDEVLATAKKVCQERSKRLPSSLLEKVITQAVVAHAPPSVGGKRLKLRGVIQSDVNPPTFILTVNDPKLLHFSYRRYLENSLRQAFDFPGTPLRLIFKSSTPKDKRLGSSSPRDATFGKKR